MKVCSFC